MAVAYAIERVTARVPPLVHHLVGRPYQEQMPANYARLERVIERIDRLEDVADVAELVDLMVA